jgi:hypothetical protein
MPGSHELMFTNLIGLADKIIEAARDWRLEGWRHPESKPTTARHWSPAPPARHGHDSLAGNERLNALERLSFGGMRIGIDFGTTHTVAAVVEKGGNYPVVSFDGVDAWPSVIAANAVGELRFGLDAAAVRHQPGWSVLRSFTTPGPSPRWTWAGALTRWPTSSRASLPG